jgi:hypothetical protein
VTFREAFAQGTASIDSQVNTIDVGSSGRKQEDNTRSDLRLGTVASTGALLSLERQNGGQNS